MSTIMHDSTETEHHPSIWDDFVWHLGCRTHSVGEYVMKLGDRIHGDEPMGLEEYGDFSYDWGLRVGMKAPRPGRGSHDRNEAARTASG
jgi:hypothetical protein